MLLHKYGFKKDKISYCPISAFYGNNLISRDTQPEELKSWYGSEGRDEEPKCLLECIEEFKPFPKKIKKPSRACVYDYYSKPPTGFTKLHGDCLTLKIL